MLTFIIHFFISNIFIAAFIGTILVAKRKLGNHLSERIQYNLWFLMLTLLTIPFLPFRTIGFLQFFSWLNKFNVTSSNLTNAASQKIAATTTESTINWMNDFSLSVSRGTPSTLSILLLAIWLFGILAMILLVAKSKMRLYYLEQSALPLQSRRVHTLFENCKKEMKITRNIPIYSTVFLKSPFTVGFIKPRIYMPIHLISDLDVKDMRYMLLHELQHYKFKDDFVNCVMNLAGIIYWFNPLVWYALKEMRNDREVACDSSVLLMLNEKDYVEYGNTLINLAEKISRTPFPFATGMGGNMKQIKRRILNIASFQPQSLGKRIRGILTYSLIAIILLGLAPILSIYANEQERYHFHEKQEDVSYIDLSSYFKEYHGSFVLYDTTIDSWQIYNKDYATLRVAPNSTYKIYNALLGLEAGIITPDHSQMTWNGEIYPFAVWNTDQDMNSAIQNSVNWYFQSLDKQIGESAVKNYVHAIGYGNEDMNGDFSSYWMESSLKISPIEQVELLQRLYNNEFQFSPENIQSIKDAILLSTISDISIYGKTGTGRVNGLDINGWFIGYIEKSGHTYFFATNIQSDSNATGTSASDITLAILSELQILK